METIAKVYAQKYIEKVIELIDTLQYIFSHELVKSFYNRSNI